MTVGYNVASHFIKVLLQPINISDVLLTIVIDYLIHSADQQNRARLIFKHDGEIILTFEETPNSSLALTSGSIWTVKNRDVVPVQIVQTLELNGHMFRVKKVGLKNERNPHLRNQLYAHLMQTSKGYALEEFCCGNWSLVKTENINNPCFKQKNDMDLVKLWMAALLISLGKQQSSNMCTIHSLEQFVAYWDSITSIVIRPTQVFYLDKRTLLMCRFTSFGTQFNTLRFCSDNHRFQWVSACASSVEETPSSYGFAECVLKTDPTRYHLQAIVNGRFLGTYVVNNDEHGHYMFSVKFILNNSEAVVTNAAKLCLFFSQKHPEHNTSIIIV